jgi:hypothetical protein
MREYGKFNEQAFGQGLFAGRKMHLAETALKWK